MTMPILFFFFFFFSKTLLILTETSTGTDRVHQAAANTEERPNIFTDNNACGAPIKAHQTSLNSKGLRLA